MTARVRPLRSSEQGQGWDWRLPGVRSKGTPNRAADLAWAALANRRPSGRKAPRRRPRWLTVLVFLLSHAVLFGLLTSQ